MKSPSTLLVVADPNMRSAVALRRAAELARLMRARLHICLFAHDSLIERSADLVSPDVLLRARRLFEEPRERWLLRQAQALGVDGLQVSCEVTWCREHHEALLGRCLAMRPDLVVLATPSASGKRNPQLSPADRKLLRFCPVPALLVPEAAPRPLLRILAAVDTGPDDAATDALNREVVRVALALALRTDAQVHLAHSVPFDATRLSSPHLRRLYPAIRDNDARAFAAFAAAHHVPEERRQLAEGNPATTLPALVQHTRADLLVLGSTSKSGFDRFLLGSVCERLAVRQPCDLLVVKPPAFLAELSRHLDLDGIRQKYARAQLHVPTAIAA